VSDSFDEQRIVATVSDELPVGVWVARAPGGELIHANRCFAEIMGMAARGDVAIGEYGAPYGIHDRSGAAYPEEKMPFVRALRERRELTIDDIVIHRSDGRKVNIRATARPVLGAGGEISHVVIAFIDITREVEAETARAASEAQLRSAQRMESLGTLAGGIAHDFNNLLTTVRMVAWTLLRDESDPARRERLDVIEQVTDRAVSLTRSLLGFAGRGKHLHQRTSLNTVVSNLTTIARRTFDRSISIDVALATGLADTMGDIGQLEQVLMNLLVNARDAMPRGGQLQVRTLVKVLSEQQASTLPPLGAGPHVLLEVADTGEGIDPALRDRIFEPYFTTKTTGSVRGTGLGLATVYGIVQAHGGAMEVEARHPGTIMRVYLPAAPYGSSIRPLEQAAPRCAPPAGHGVVLLVEDEHELRDAALTVLRDLGYEVITAADGVEAVERFQERAADVRAVVLDMIMPRQGGHETYLALRAIDPEVRVLLTSGYSLNEEAQRILDLGVKAFLPKPYSIDDLAALLGRVIDP
jgi:signal transduction histidine kinase/CheY-like chemotaxis protein